MGVACNCATREGPNLSEEDQIVTYEEKLGYKFLASETILNTFSQYAEDGIIKRDKFLELWNLLQVNTSGIDNPQNPIYIFYSNFESSPGCMDQRKITTLALILSNLETPQKVPWLFQHYDLAKTGFLSTEDVELMLMDVFLLWATTFAEFSLEYSRKLEVSSYQASCECKILEAIYVGKLWIMPSGRAGALDEKDSVSQEDFISVMQGQWLSSTRDVRKFILKAERPQPNMNGPKMNGPESQPN